MPFYVKRLSRELLRILAIVVLVIPAIGTGVARADTSWTQTTQPDFSSGTTFQVDVTSSPGDVKLATTGAGGNYVYGLQGNRQYGFWQYDVSADSWTSLAATLGKVKWGGALAYDGSNYIYAFRGYDTKAFWRYDISADSWISLDDAPGTVAEGGALTYNGGNYIYALRGDNSKYFWRYDISADSWTSLANTDDNVGGGGALASDGGNYVYSFQCVGTDVLWRYDIASDIWTLMADTPTGVGNGAALTYDGSDYIYALAGDDTKSFWRYDIVTDNWSLMADTPDFVEWGGALTYDGGSYVYAFKGKYTKNFWRYDISTDSWDSMANTPGYVRYGGALTMSGVSYQSSGTLTSSTHDTGYFANFGSITWTSYTPAGTSIQFQIATNNDNSTWNFIGPDGTSGTYYTSSGVPIWAGHDNDRYIKYKAFLSTTDTSKTPVMHDITINYNQQATLPTVATSNSTLVEETTATYHGTITSDGGEACQYSFEWGTTPGGPYTDNTSWTGSKTTGESFSADITGLSEGTKYYFRARAMNGAGFANGSELSFLTKPDEPISFSASANGSTLIDLSWSKGDGAVRTMVRRKTGSDPTSISEGVEVYFDTGTGVSDTGLSSNTTYFYSAWSEVTGSQQWSDAYATASATTGSGPPPLPPPTAVGGTIYQINKAQVLAPWLGLFLTLSLVVWRVFFRVRKRV
ncbi:hypothetical protein ACFLWU_06495 [Chloroflexota bacterium]